MLNDAEGLDEGPTTDDRGLRSWARFNRIALSNREATTRRAPAVREKSANASRASQNMSQQCFWNHSWDTEALSYEETFGLKGIGFGLFSVIGLAEVPNGCSQTAEAMTCVTLAAFENSSLTSESSAGKGVCDAESPRDEEQDGICSFEAAASVQQLSSALSQVNM